MNMEINPSEYKILIVDDVMSNVLLLKVLLTNEKFQIATASNGRQAIDQVEKEKPDLVLLDVMMPDMSGFEVSQQLKANPETSEIPIIFLTALNSTADIVKGFQVGGNDFISKPFNKEELIIRVTHQISLIAAKRIIVAQTDAAIVLAAGQGKRMKSNIQKQFLLLEEKPVIWYALHAFEESRVDDVILVTGADE